MAAPEPKRVSRQTRMATRPHYKGTKIIEKPQRICQEMVLTDEKTPLVNNN